MEAVASFDTWVWHAFFGVVGSQNDLNVLGQSPIFNDVLRGHSPQITYRINNTVYSGAYYLGDGIYLRWTTFVKTIPNPNPRRKKAMLPFKKYDYDAPEVSKPDPMNTVMTRIYERLIGVNGQPMKHEPLIRDGRYNNPMIDRYQEIQSSYVRERRQVDLIEHFWEMKGNHSG
ncbi:unnamed protein product [Prunus brigantina]